MYCTLSVCAVIVLVTIKEPVIVVLALIPTVEPELLILESTIWCSSSALGT